MSSSATGDPAVRVRGEETVAADYSPVTAAGAALQGPLHQLGKGHGVRPVDEGDAQ